MLSKLLTAKEQALLAGCAAAICVGGLAYYFAAGQETKVAVKEVVVARPEAIAPVAALTSQVAPQPAAPETIPSPTQVSEPVRSVRISVAGAVVAPGVYEFAAGDRVADAVKAAGGTLDDADTSDINQAATLLDGTTLTIPLAGKAGIEDGKRMVLRSGESAAAMNPPEYTVSGWANRKTTPIQRAATTATSAADKQTEGGLLDLNSATPEELEALPGVGPKTAVAIIEYRTRQPFQSVDDLDNVAGIGEKKLNDIRPLVTVGAR
ncbi:MAG TPA: ComEA family DNA-binding protein [Candidatus Hydrogenedentes bacterium]|nr:ComEA family DNA-binding protein [Candidatus Hydrogenedentota bacterium]